MTSASDLFALMEIDLRRDARRAMIADIESRLGETETLVNAREAAADAEEDLKGLQAAQRRLDGKLEDLDAKIKPLEEKLYGGSVRNPTGVIQSRIAAETRMKRTPTLTFHYDETIEKGMRISRLLEEES